MDIDQFFTTDSNFPGQYGPLFQRFERRRRIMQNVTLATRKWYAGSWIAFRDSIKDATDERSLKEGIEDGVEKILERGTSAISVNTYLRAMGAWCRWMLIEERITRPIKLPKLRAEKKQKTPLTDEEIGKLFHYKPHTRHDRQMRAVAILCLDAGLRAMEWQALTRDNLDLEGCTVKVDGKGRKQRIIPISYDTVRVLREYLDEIWVDSPLVFPTDAGSQIMKRNALKRLKLLAVKAGVRGSINLHGLRHSFASRYIINGGSTALLQELMGHEDLATTQNYLHFTAVELKTAHLKYSPIGKIAKRAHRPVA